jgi:hypothetical protein
MAVDRYYYMERETGNILELEEIAVAIYGSRAEADRLAIPVYMAEDVEHLLPRSTEETKTEQVKPECAHCDHSYIDHVDDGMPGECIIMGCLCDEYTETALNTTAATDDESDDGGLSSCDECGKSYQTCECDLNGQC